MTDRAVSTALNYVLSLAVVTALISGLFIAANDIVEDQRERAIQSELIVLGNQVAADLSSLDRLAIGNSGRASVETNLPDRVAGKHYLIAVRTTGISGRYEITLSTEKPAVTVTAVVRLDTPIDPTELGGGDVTLVYDGTSIEVRDG